MSVVARLMWFSWQMNPRLQEDCLYIALAGQHQIWRHDLASGTTTQFSGDGSERNANGRSNRTAWAQPSGLSLSPDGNTLWVADSESSSIRSLSTLDGSSQASPCLNLLWTKSSKAIYLSASRSLRHAQCTGLSSSAAGTCGRGLVIQREPIQIWRSRWSRLRGAPAAPPCGLLST